MPERFKKSLGTVVYTHLPVWLSSLGIVAAALRWEWYLSLCAPAVH